MVLPIGCIYLDGNCRVFRLQPFSVRAAERRNISKSRLPSVTTETRGSPNTNIPSISLNLQYNHVLESIERSSSTQ